MTHRYVTTVLLTLALCLAATIAEAVDSTGTRPFWAEFEGVVEIDASDANGPVVLIRPDAGLPLIVNTDGIQEWRRREGRRVEVEGDVRITAAGAVMDVVELSHEKGSWGSRSPVSLEGYVTEENGQPVLQTRSGGSVPLVVGSRRVWSDRRRVEIDGMFVSSGDSVAVEVHDVDYD
ncbi:MAG: hypothetical protein LIQ31_12735 [Planctomycetes bacterium]|nr:hypothetical protein [Planctomycetota bacterium]